MASSSSNNNDSSTSRRDQLRALREDLYDASTATAVVASGKVKAVPQLRVRDESGKTTTFPWSSATLAGVRNVMTTAPFGRGAETVIDKTVRNGLDLEGSRLTIDFDWEKKVNKIVKDAMQQISGPSACAEPVEAELYKMLLYDKGGEFKMHRDTQRSAGHFATLVITLPAAAHEGGALVVGMGDNKTTVASSGSKPTHVEWSCFFTDVPHTVKPVTEGTRVALMYMLYRDDDDDDDDDDQKERDAKRRKVDQDGEDEAGPTLIESVINKHVATLQQVGPVHLGLFCTHLYTPAALEKKGVRALKGCDAALYAALEKHFPARVRVAAVEARLSGYGYSDYAPKTVSQETWKKDVAESVSGVAVTIDELDVTQRGEEKNTFASRMLYQRGDSNTTLVDFNALVREHIVTTVAAAKKTDQSTHGYGNEGCEVHATYLSTAIIFTVGDGAPPIDEPFTFENSGYCDIGL